MPEAVNKAFRILSEQMVQRIVLLRFLLFVVGAIVTSITVALVGTSWADANAQTKFLIVLSIVGNIANTLGAFFDKSLARVVQGKDIYDDGTSGPFENATKTPAKL
jgi:hypothetical protein